MERYSEYKDSGVKWLGEIPSHWEVLRIKNVVDMFGRIGFRGYTADDLVEAGAGAITLSPTNIIDGELDFTNCSYLSWKKYYESPEIMVKAGDVVLVKTASVGKCALVRSLPKETTVNPQFLVFKNIEANSAFFTYILQDYVQCFLDSEKNGSTISTISQQIIGNFKIMLPPRDEQDAIVRYLDAATSKIDKAIAMQQKMIDLLNERKQIIIQNAVTKGLDENVEMKDSGVEWIGMIPKHWEVVRLSRLTSKIGSGSTPKEGYVDNGVIFLRSQNVYCEGLRLDDVVHISPNVHRNMSGTRVLPNDVLINITGGSIGRCFYVDETLGEANVNQHVSIIRPTSVDTHYLKYYLQSYCGQIQVALEQTGGNREGLTAKALAKFLIVCPPKSEQQAVAAYLDKEMQHFDSAITNCQRQITLLQERKQIIINEVVTGKVKVS